MQRCGWVTPDPLYQHYHDEEWGRPLTDRQRLFEMLCLEGQQAGLSWITVLKKRAAYREAFFQFAPEQVATLDERALAQRLTDDRLIRHRGKLSAIIGNARALLAMEAAGEPFVSFIWQFVDHQQQVNHFASLAAVPAITPASEAMSKALKKRGFRFVGPTICYAFMQACGLVNDHTTDCFCHPGEQK
ncbi:DNA-3-methyladenine glycosylase I [Pantoea sp. 1.19]|uniref:DNA-3-methyladenine glycosylase I n=1 Tax=Pantoea sp. 1.19 TaxID=1925589 RepID=UPI000948D69F|nr:DNA-3-methyladenine glycosylase I [Pantoea sp. 1.19]